MELRSEPPSAFASSIFMRNAQTQKTTDIILATSTDVLQRNLRTPSEGAIILL